MKAILFDLDGTLLPLDLDNFMKVYFYEMSKVFSDICDIQTLSERVMEATRVMVKDTSERTNKEVFSEAYASLIEEDIERHWEKWDDYYENGYKKVRTVCGKSPEMIEAVKIIKQKGFRMILATNPLFPRYAIEQRIEWAGLLPTDFDYISSIEDNCYCKPQLKYYEEILGKNSLNPLDCLMVGNDVTEDMIAGKLGMKTYLVEDYLLHRNGEEIMATYRGSMKDFLDFVRNLK